MLITPVLAPAAVSPEEAKTHLRVEINDDDMLIDSLIATATSMAEHELGRALVTQEFTLAIDQFPRGAIYLQRPPVQSIVSVKYLDESGAQQTLAAESYRLIKNPLAPSITSDSWPTGTEVEIKYVAGYGDAAAVPAQIKQWILVHIGAMYENRESVGKPLEPIPFVDRLLDRYKVW